MKTHFFLLPLVTLAPLAASAQPKPGAPKAAPQISMDPAAKALLDQATATYKNAKGLSLSVASSVDGKDTGTSNVQFSRPNTVSVERKSGKNSLRLLLDGTNFYVVQGTSYQKAPPPAGMSATQLVGGVGNVCGTFIAAMLDGKNPLDFLQGAYSKPPFQSLKARTVALSPRVVDGDTLSGVQSTYSFKVPGRNGTLQEINSQTTAWFGGSPLVLRRVQARLTQGKTITLTEKIVDQQLNPTFAPDTFKFDPTGLKLASAQDDSSYFDPRLKVGAQPFAFSTKALNGTTISPANYKGKVLLMDFWATWCGPCVASLPELQSAYKKYHAQGLEVVGISLDEDKSALTSFTKANKMPWPQVFDGKGWNSAVPGIYGVKAIPFMLIIGKDGKIASVNPRGNIDAAVKAALAGS